MLLKSNKIISESPICKKMKWRITLKNQYKNEILLNSENWHTHCDIYVQMNL